jgi:O-antigen ligase
MIANINKIISNATISDKLVFLLVALFPLSAVVGNLFINLTFVILFIIFFLEIFLNKNYLFLKDITFWIVVFFFSTLLINFYFSIDQMNSLTRVLKILLMITFTIQLKQIIQKYPEAFEEIIFKSWSIILSLVLIDVVFEIIFGFNMVGIKSSYPGRISSFFGDEHIVGGFLLGFGIFYICQISLLLKKYKKLLISIILVLIFISLLIGERSNFIKFSISTLIISFFIIKINLKGFLLTIAIFFFTFFSLINLNDSMKYRYKTFFTKTTDNKIGIVKYLKNSQHIAHYDAAFKIFQEYPIFGIGLKNYRYESAKKKYQNDNLKQTMIRAAMHPHQIHFEFLSETGLFGYISFLILITISLYLSIRNYLKFKNIFQLSSIIYIIAFMIPFLPSGSFFSTFTSALFWVNYAVMMAYNKDITTKLFSK